MAEIPILYRDEHLLVVDKPPGMLVVPAPGRSGSTVVEVLSRQLGVRVYPVHRLDEDTTGVLIVASTLPAKAQLEAMFRRHAVERVYLAVVVRAPQPPAGRIESRLRADEGGVVRSVERGPGQRAVTHYRTLARTNRGAVVECRLETGRRNQIRAHLAELGSVIVGDRKYGYRGRGVDAPRRPLLHAWRSAFEHPVSGGDVRVEAPVPPGFPSF
jgi:23S rRNA pseudouridine1911/1915/1917 synthase